MLPQASIAVQVRVTLYSCGQSPGVVTSANVKLGSGSHTSAAVGSLNTGPSGHSTLPSGPTPLITGAVSSSIETTLSQTIDGLQSSHEMVDVIVYDPQVDPARTVTVD